MISRGEEALKVSGILTQVIEKNPGCFEGEDLSIAYALADKLKSEYFGSKEVPAPERGSIRLSEEEIRVLTAAEACAKGQKAAPKILPPATRIPEPSEFPTTTVLAVGGVAIAGLIALLIFR